MFCKLLGTQDHLSRFHEQAIGQQRSLAECKYIIIII